MRKGCVYGEGLLVNNTPQFTFNNHQHFIQSNIPFTLLARAHEMRVARTRLANRAARIGRPKRARLTTRAVAVAVARLERDTRLYRVFLVIAVASGLRRADVVAPHAPTESIMAATAA